MLRYLNTADLRELDATRLHRVRTPPRPATVRSLDAIHLATALWIQPEFFITYDKRLAGAAREAGLAVETPGA